MEAVQKRRSNKYSRKTTALQKRDKGEAAILLDRIGKEFEFRRPKGIFLGKIPYNPDLRIVPADISTS